MVLGAFTQWDYIDIVSRLMWYKHYRTKDNPFNSRYSYIAAVERVVPLALGLARYWPAPERQSLSTVI